MPSADFIPEVQLFTDGAMQRQPGTGRLGLHSAPPRRAKEMEQSGAERLTTNNKMELMAVIGAWRR
jgi:ribonuclease HI